MEEISIERKVSIKRADIVHKHHKYLINIWNLRQADSKIVFVDKRLLDRNPTFTKSWQTIADLQFISIPTPETGLQF
jgi:hypothetical protein